MKAILVIPARHTPEKKFRLEPKLGRRGAVIGFLMFPATVCRVLNGLRFQDLRDVLGARIETDDVRAAAEALHLPANDPGLILRT